MVRLSSETEERDALRVLEASRRRLVLPLVSEMALRKPGPKQARQIAGLRRDLEQQIVDQLEDSGRRAFRGHIAVDMALEVPRSGRHVPELGTMVKAYLDLLKERVIPDDAVVDHLFAWRTVGWDGQARVTLRCLPMSVFTAEFDRAFRLADEISFGYVERRPRFRDGSPLPDLPPEEWGLSRFDEHDRSDLASQETLLDRLRDLDAETEAQLDEDPDATVDLDLSSTESEFADPGDRERTQEFLVGSIALARGRLLADQGFDVRDRPGPEPAWLGEVDGESPADIVELPDAGPGCFLLPAPALAKTPAGQPSWDDVVLQRFERRRLEGWWTVRFGGPLALDIALRGHAAPDADVDNVAKRIVAAFRSAFAPAEPQVDGYRAYRQVASTDDVRVRVMPIGRMLCLVRAMRRAETVIRSERASRRRST